MKTQIKASAGNAIQAGTEQVRQQVGRRLRVLRVESQYRTTADLAEAIEARFGARVDSRHLYALEMGQAKAEIELWWMLSEIYETDIRALVGKTSPIARPRRSVFNEPRWYWTIRARRATAG